MARHFEAQANQRLLDGDIGTQIAEGFWMQDLGRQDAEGDETPIVVPGHDSKRVVSEDPTHRRRWPRTVVTFFA